MSDQLSLLKLAAHAGHAEASYSLGKVYANGRGGVQRNSARAIAYFQQAAAKGHAKSLCNLGVLREKGVGVPRSDAVAAEYYKRAAAAGSSKAAFNLAVLLQQGRGIAQNEARAAEYFRVAGEGGHVKSLNNLACALEQGRGVEQDRGEALRMYERAAEGGDAKAAFNLGMRYLKGVNSGDGEKKICAPDEARAVKLLQQAADTGHAKSLCSLGVLFERGGVATPRNAAVAAKFYTKAAEFGDRKAMTNLSALYRSGTGVAEDPRVAAALLRQAAEAGDGKAMYNLGTVLLRGDARAGVARDVRAACHVFEGVPAGSPFEGKARFNAALVYFDQHDELLAAEGVPADADAAAKRGLKARLDAKAFRLFKRAAELDIPQAQFKVGMCYAEGRGTKQDHQLAIANLKGAAKRQIKGASDAISRLESGSQAF